MYGFRRGSGPESQPGREKMVHNGGMRAWMTSLVTHLMLLALLALVTVPAARNADLLIVSSQVNREVLPTETFHFSDDEYKKIGARTSLSSAAPVKDDEPLLYDLMMTANVAPIQVSSLDQLSRAPAMQRNVAVHGEAGVAVTGAVGAIDRITHEILLSLEQRRTLVVWLFDQSASLQGQRESIRSRFDRIYHELGVVQAGDNPAFSSHHDKPLLSSVMAFGNTFTFRTEEPTDDASLLKEIVGDIETDPSGKENVFSAIYHAARKYRQYRMSSPRRNVMLVVFTDEAGDDMDRLDQAVTLCHRCQIPVYVVGVPAPFGREVSMVKYVDPNPNFNQQPQWAPVHQGPESYKPERLRLHFPGDALKDPSMDSGFGPYGLARLCVETGGIYFSVHPNRRTDKRIEESETAEMTSHLESFFDPKIMLRYRPDYISAKRYKRALEKNQARVALVEASTLSWVMPMESVRLKFPKESDAQLANILSVAQRAAAKLEPQVNRIYILLNKGLRDREKLVRPRWQAGYDLALGRTLAVKVRTESYNAMLAMAKQGLQFENPQNDTWLLQKSTTLPAALSGQLKKHADQAQEYLKRVVKDHPGTPWAELAARELLEPLGWVWTETFTGVRVPERSSIASGAVRPQDDRIQMLAKPKPKRLPPAL